MSATKNTIAGPRAYTAEPIAVAPGETIHGSAWVKVKDVPEKTGAVIMIAGFSDSGGGNESVQKFNTAPLAEAGRGWVKIEGNVKVPELADAIVVNTETAVEKNTDFASPMPHGASKFHWTARLIVRCANPETLVLRHARSCLRRLSGNCHRD